jgi:hypothetical protein
MYTATLKQIIRILALVRNIYLLKKSKPYYESVIAVLKFFAQLVVDN